jgi:hypothetical protein
MDLTQFSRNFPGSQTLGRKRQKSLNTSLNTLHLSTVEVEGSYPLVSPFTEMSTNFNGLNFTIPQVQNNWSNSFVQIPTRTHSMQSGNSISSMNTIDINVQGNMDMLQAGMDLQGQNSNIPTIGVHSMDTDLVSDDIKSVFNPPALEHFRLDLDHTNKFVKQDYDMRSSSTEELAKRQSYDSLPDFHSNYHDFGEFQKRSSNIDLNAEYGNMRSSDSFEHLRLPNDAYGIRTSSLDQVNVEPDFSMFMDPQEDARMVMNDIQRRLSDQRRRSVSASTVSKRERRVRRISDQVSEPQIIQKPTIDICTPCEPPMPDEEEGEEAKPRKQTLKFENDMYTPHWVRYQGSKKEGYCDLCKPGRWLQLKTSAYWY